MQWPDERYVRLYTRDTTTWKLWSWQSRFVFMSLLRKVDRSGVLDLGGEDLRGLAAVIEVPLEIVEAGLPGLLRAGTVEHHGDRVGIPNYIEAQEAIATNAKRCRDYRDRMTRNVSHPTRNMSVPTRGDTEQHAATRGDTPSLAVPSRAVPSLANPDPPSGDLPLAGQPPPAPSVGEGSSRRPQKRSKPAATRLPESFQVTESHELWARKNNLPDPHGEFEAFCDHHRKVGSAFVDWDAAFRTWVRKAPEFSKRNQAARGAALQQPPPGGSIWQFGNGAKR